MNSEHESSPSHSSGPRPNLELFRGILRRQPQDCVVSLKIHLHSPGKRALLGSPLSSWSR